jgi:hypothetical protein
MSTFQKSRLGFEIIGLITFANIAANTFDSNLYQLPESEIGLNSFKETGNFTFGINVTK